MPADDLTTDESRWPIVVHTTIGIPSEDQVDAMLRRANEILARGQPHFVVFDNTRAGSVPSYMRNESVRWVKENKSALEQHCVGMALVIRSPALRFIMSTVMLVTAHAVPAEVFRTLDDAIAWGHDRLAQRG